MAACKSFKQLVEARDERIVKALYGKEGHKGKHYSYICFRAKTDNFMAVYFNLPQTKDFERYWSSTSDPEILNIYRWVKIHTAFNEELPTESAIANQWYDDHSDDKLYAFEFVNMEAYDKGMFTYWVSDYGRWSRPAESQRQALDDAGVFFEGAWAWLENLAINGNTPAVLADDPKQGHIEISASNIYVHYSFKNQLDTLTSYTLQVQRSTGRFTETYEPFKVSPIEDSGTCMVFKE